MQWFHGRPEPFSCQTCDLKSTIESELGHHKAKHRVKEKSQRQPEPYTCHKCEYTTKNEPDLEHHKVEQHENQCYDRVNHGIDIDIRKSQKERRGTRYCHYWNYSSCRFGDSCRFLHEEIPACRYQESCYKESCPFFHVVSRKTRNRNLSPQNSQPLSQEQNHH